MKKLIIFSFLLSCALIGWLLNAQPSYGPYPSGGGGGGGGGGTTTNVNTLTPGSVVWVNGSSGNNFTLTANQNFTLAFTNGLSDMQIVVVRIKQDSTGNRILTLDTNTIAMGRSITGATLSTNAGYYDYLAFRLNTGEGKWDIVGTPDGYH